jgi:hypothetical protein
MAFVMFFSAVNVFAATDKIIKVSSSTYVSVGWEKKLNASAGTALKYKSSDKSVVKVTRDGVIRGVKKGNAKITVTAAAKGKYKAAKKTVSVSVVDPAYNKNVLIEGDSIQAKAGQHIYYACRQMQAASVTLNAIVGASLGYNPDSRAGSNSVYYRISNMTDEELRSFHMIFISAGTNDWNSKKADIKCGDPDSKDPASICGALNLILKRINKVAPKTKIVIETPVHRFKYIDPDTREVFPGTDCDQTRNRYDCTLQDFRDAMKSVAAKYKNTYVVNGENITTAEEMMSPDFTSDGLHPKHYYGKNILSVRFTEELNRVMGM